MTIGIAVLVSTGMTLVPWLARRLSGSGAVAAWLIGFLVLWATSWAGFWVLGGFASALAVRSSAQAGEQSDTGGRSGRQVLANGGVAALGSLGEFWSPGLGIWLLTIVLAAAGADTWATTFGMRSRRPPRDILRGQVVEPGISGGVTWLGTIGGVLGASCIGTIGGLVSHSLALAVVATGVGIFGMVIDSILGSAWQGRFRCPACNQPTERPVHDCGLATELVAGQAWLDNDRVNATVTVFAFAAGLVLWPTS